MTAIPIDMEDVYQAAHERECEVCKGFIMGECTAGREFCGGFQNAIAEIKAEREAEAEKTEADYE